MTVALLPSSSFALYRTYQKRLRSFTFLFIVEILSDFFSTFLGMVPPLFSILLFDYAYPQRSLKLLTLATLAGLAIYFVNFFFSAINKYMNAFVDEKLSTSLSEDLLRKVMSLPLSSPMTRNIGDTTVRILEDSDVCAGLILNAPQALFISLTNLILFLLISLSINPYITLLSLASIPIYLIETNFFSSHQSRLQEETQKNRSDTYDSLQERLLNVRTIKSFCREDYEVGRFKICLNQRILLNIKQNVIGIIATFSNSITLQIWSTFVAWYMGYEVVGGRLSLGQMIALAAYLPQIASPIHDLADLYTNLRVGMVSLRRVDGLLTFPSETMEDSKESISLEKGGIEASHLTFHYADSPPVLKDMTFSIPPGSSMAVVGASGGGKSTLVNLLLQFYQPSSGMIYFDGQQVSQVHINSLRKQIGVVFQEISLFAGTVRENILYGSPNSSENDLDQAARLAAAHDFIMKLPGGYDYPIEHFGRNLSGGQKQRIAIARALAMKPRILILDEAASALDAESEFLIQEMVQSCRGKITVIIVAHRFSSIKGVGKIIVLERGAIVESGAFSELMAKKGVFFSLYQLQMGGFQEFQQRLEMEFARYQRYRQNLSLVLLEVLNYDQIAKSEKSGQVARLMEALNLFVKKSLRVMDFSCVFRDREIVIGMPETNDSSAHMLSYRLIKSIGRYSFSVDEKIFRIIVAAKLVSCEGNRIQYADQLIEMADESGFIPIPLERDPEQTIRETIS